MTKNKLIFFTKYSQKGPSSRYRTFNYLPFFTNLYNVKVYTLFDDFYINNLYSDNPRFTPFYLLKRYLQRVYQLLFLCSSDSLLVIEYELFPYFFPLFENYLKWRGINYLLDFDDAIFHNYDISKSNIVRKLFSRKISHIASNAEHIISGSPYLTKYFLQYNKHVTEIPTSIDFGKYNQLYHPNSIVTPLIIGWLGSNSTARNLIDLIPVFQKVSHQNPEVLFKFCGVGKDIIGKFKNFRFEILDWTPENEMSFLNDIHVGIMPLELNNFNNGKCGFKLIQYMAMGNPTISTPLMANVKIDHGNGNLFANTNEEWLDAFDLIINNYDSFKKVGLNNIKTIDDYYSIHKNFNKYLEIFNNKQ